MGGCGHSQPTSKKDHDDSDPCCEVDLHSYERPYRYRQDEDISHYRHDESRNSEGRSIYAALNGQGLIPVSGDRDGLKDDHEKSRYHETDVDGVDDL